jgi:hypothetical protein
MVMVDINGAINDESKWKNIDNSGAIPNGLSDSQNPHPQDDPFALYNRQQADQTAKEAKAAQAARDLHNVINSNTQAQNNEMNDVLNVNLNASKALYDKQTNDNRSKMGSEWWDRYMKLGHSIEDVRESAGNALYGSGLHDLQDLADTQKNIDLSEILGQQRDNQNQINNTWAEAQNENNNSFNENYIKMIEGLRSNNVELANQLYNINPDEFKLPDDVTYDSSKLKQAVTPQTQGFYTQNANSNVASASKPNTSTGNANSAYWADMLNNYNKRDATRNREG